MALSKLMLSGVMGLNVQGDVGGMTFYTASRGQLVGFGKSPPLSPASPTQRIYRDRLAAAATDWNALTPATRNAWELLSKRAKCKCTGYNLWTWLQLKGDPTIIQTIERQTGVDVGI